MDTEVQLAGKSDDSSMIILDKIRSATWNSKPPNLRIVKEKCEHRATQWQQIPQSPPTSPQPSPHDLPTKRDRSAALELLHVLSSDPRGQVDTHTFFKELEE